MKPHFVLHYAKTMRHAPWWVALMAPGDRNYTVRSTLNFHSSRDAINAARWLMPGVRKPFEMS